MTDLDALRAAYETGFATETELDALAAALTADPGLAAPWIADRELDAELSVGRWDVDRRAAEVMSRVRTVASRPPASEEVPISVWPGWPVQPWIPRTIAASLILVALVGLGVLIGRRQSIPRRIDRWQLTRLEVGSRTVYPVPTFERFEVLDSNALTAIPNASKTQLTLIGLRSGSTVVRLVLPRKDGTVQYVELPFDVVRPRSDIICAHIREEHQGQSPAELTRIARKHFANALSYYEARNSHRKNLYYAHESAQKAWCLLEPLPPSKVRREAKDLLDRTKEELRAEYQESKVRVARFIRLRQWRDLGIELEKVMQLFPDSRDPRHQRALNLRSRYKDPIQLDTQGGPR